MITEAQQKTLDRASRIMEKFLRNREYQVSLANPQEVKDYLRYKLATKEHEEFHVVFLTSQHEIIATECMFTGTLDSASVYPREVVKRTLEHNAAALIFAHNHPSGKSTPSQADEAITKRLQHALETIDVRVLDHFVVGNTICSFAERGLI